MDERRDRVEGWTWDPSLYAGSAPYYVRGRLPYAPGLRSALGTELGLDGTGRLLDVGTGPGIIALQLASLFDQVVGIDADEAMIEQAELEARRVNVANVRWAVLRAEDLPARLGSFRAVTFAQSFHWTLREPVARTVRGMLDPDGTVVLISAYTRAGIEAGEPLDPPRVPRAAIGTLLRRYLGPVRRAGAGSLPAGTPSDEADVLTAAGFELMTEISVPDDRVFIRSVDDVVASVYSVSGSAPHLFGDRLAEFDAELTRLLRDASPAGSFSERAGDTSVRIFRPVRD